MKYALVAFPSSPQAFTFAVHFSCAPGDLVAAPLRNKTVNGIVLEITKTEPSFATKPLIEMVREKVLADWQVQLAVWLAEYYKAHLGKTLRLFAPERVWQDKPLKNKRKEVELYPMMRPEMTLNAAQKKAVEKIIGGEKAAQFLLHGITGSGKTEVYLHAIRDTMGKGKQAILLVPEIALTPQLVGYFAAAFDKEMIAVLHSHLADGARLAAWERIQSGEAQLVIGSRSALFAPAINLDLVILDEEHEWTYKNDQSPRYHARRAAQQMAQLTGARLVLGTATPSVETFAAATAGKITKLELPERATTGVLPSVQIVDLRQELKKQNYSPFSELLTEQINDRLAKKEQIVLLLNKRGYSSSLVCRDCGESVHCSQCALPATLHHLGSKEYLQCHLCGHRGLPPTACGQCGSLRIKALGAGTQQIESELKKLFPTANVLRADLDTTSRVGSHQEIFDEFKSGKADILLGTQMVAKGLDVPNVTLVGVLLADVGLHMPDFRAGEKTFGLLTQVAGRAGRAEKKGEVVIQTYSPEHPAIRAAAKQDYGMFYAAEIKEREDLGYPPFARIVKFAFVDPSEKTAREAAQTFAKELKNLYSSPFEGEARRGGDTSSTLPQPLPSREGSSVLCAPALISKIYNKYHWHVVWRGANPEQMLKNIEIPDGCRVDVDPMQVV